MASTALFSDSIICPVCSASLSQHDSVLRCASGHSFDRAKQGYYNLLLNQHKKSKQPGDSAEMVQARKRFLETGLYSPLVDNCLQVVTQAVENSPCSALRTIRYCDIACGEGYYTSRFAEALGARYDRVKLCGVDISTPAIKSAAKRLSGASWLVANAFSLPLRNASQDLVTHMFARPSPKEAARTLKAGGLLLDVSAAPGHLIELRQALYETIPDKEGKVDWNEYADHFDVINEHDLCFTIRLESSQQISDLVHMTPHAWKAKPGKLADYLSQTETSVTCEFKVSLLSKRNSSHKLV